MRIVQKETDRLDVVAEIPARRKIIVLGDVSEPPGSPGPIYRRLGGRGADIATQAIFIGRNDNSYQVGAVRRGMSRNAITRAGRSLKSALSALPSDLGEGDIVLIKGRTTSGWAESPWHLWDGRYDVTSFHVMHAIRSGVPGVECFDYGVMLEKAGIKDGY